MVTLTSAAADQLKSFAQASGVPEGVVRLFLVGGGCCGPSFAFDVAPQKEASDVGVVHESTTLYVQDEAVALLGNATIDFQDGFLLRGLQRSSCCG